MKNKKAKRETLPSIGNASLFCQMDSRLLSICYVNSSNFIRSQYFLRPDTVSEYLRSALPPPVLNPDPVFIAAAVFLPAGCHLLQSPLNKVRIPILFLFRESPEPEPRLLPTRKHALRFCGSLCGRRTQAGRPCVLFFVLFRLHRPMRPARSTRRLTLRSAPRSPMPSVRPFSIERLRAIFGPTTLSI